MTVINDHHNLNDNHNHKVTTARTTTMVATTTTIKVGSGGDTDVSRVPGTCFLFSFLYYTNDFYMFLHMTAIKEMRVGIRTAQTGMGSRHDVCISSPRYNFFYAFFFSTILMLSTYKHM
jgi:hypothetical protein